MKKNIFYYLNKHRIKIAQDSQNRTPTPGDITLTNQMPALRTPFTGETPNVPPPPVETLYAGLAEDKDKYDKELYYNVPPVPRFTKRVGERENIRLQWQNRRLTYIANEVIKENHELRARLSALSANSPAARGGTRPVPQPPPFNKTFPRSSASSAARGSTRPVPQPPPFNKTFPRSSASMPSRGGVTAAPRGRIPSSLARTRGGAVITPRGVGVAALGAVGTGLAVIGVAQMLKQLSDIGKAAEFIGNNTTLRRAQKYMQTYNQAGHRITFHKALEAVLNQYSPEERQKYVRELLEYIQNWRQKQVNKGPTAPTGWRRFWNDLKYYYGLG